MTTSYERNQTTQHYVPVECNVMLTDNNTHLYLITALGCATLKISNHKIHL